jgi:membrane protein involved in colicin uptake
MFIRRVATTKNGRAAWLALKGQMEGPAVIDAQKKKAHVDLDTAFYTGKSKNYTWDDYIRVRQEAHLELELLEAPVDEMRKVDLMFEGVKAEALGPVILALKANGDYTNDFDKAQHQIKKAINQMGIEARQAAAQRSISAVGAGPSGNNAGGGGGGSGKRTRGGHGGGSNKKQKGEEAGGQTGQQSA